MSSQLESVNLPATRVGLSASAGSGKTFELTNHYLRSYLQGVPPQQILATTFTRKAAGEILGRVLLRLSNACQSDEQFRELTQTLDITGLTREQAMQKLLELGRTLHRMRVATLDSFFGQILRSYCFDIGITSGLRMVEEDAPEVERLQTEAIRCMLAENKKDELLALFDGMEEGRARRSVVTSLLKRFKQAHELFESVPPQAWETPYSIPRTLTGEEFAQALDALQALADAPGYEKFAKVIGEDCSRAQNQDWKDFFKTGLTKKLLLDESEWTFNRKPIPPEFADYYRPLIDHARGIQLSRHAERTRALYTALARYDEHYRRLRLGKGILFFRDAPLQLAGLLSLQAQPALEHRLDNRLTHLLLDEFQDTSPLQYSVLKPFIERIAALPPGQGLLFCVGDLKQSIYGWRGATPEIFTRLGKEFQLEWKLKNESYRSSPVVLKTVNRLFASLSENPVISKNCPQAGAEWSGFFEEHHVASSKKNGPGQTGYVAVLQSPGMDEDSEQESNDSDNDVSLAANNPHDLYVLQQVKKIVADAPGASIGILMRGNAAVTRILNLLQAHGIAATGESGEAVADDVAVALVLSALHFSQHPGDSAALFHLAHSPLAEPLGLRGESGLSPCEAATEIRRMLMRMGYAKTIASWTEILAPHCDRESLLRLMQLMELADEFDYGDCNEFIALARRQTVEQSVPAPIRVMTIHKSKGLEFDVIVLPDLGTKLQRPETFLKTHDSRTQEINRICVWPNKELCALEPVLEEMQQEHSRVALRETLCVLYVAMTRARHALYLIVPPLGVKANGDVKTTPFTYASIVRAGLCGAQSLAAVSSQELLYKDGEPDWYGKIPREPVVQKAAPEAPPAPPFVLEETETVPRRMQVVTPSSLEGGTRRSAKQLLQPRQSQAAMRGVQVHDELSGIEWMDEAPRNDSLELLPAIREHFKRPLLAEGEAVGVWRERPFAVRVAGQLVEGVFDRVVWVRNGHVYVRAEIFDFKTGRDDDGAVQYYRPQLEMYREALAVMLQLEPRSIRCRLLFTDSGRVVTI